MSEKSRSGAGETIRLGQKTAELALAGVFTAPCMCRCRSFPLREALCTLAMCRCFLRPRFLDGEWERSVAALEWRSQTF